MQHSQRGLYQPVIETSRDPELSAYQLRVNRRMRKIVFTFLGLGALIVAIAAALGSCQSW